MTVCTYVRLRGCPGTTPEPVSSGNNPGRLGVAKMATPDPPGISTYQYVVDVVYKNVSCNIPEPCRVKPGRGPVEPSRNRNVHKGITYIWNISCTIMYCIRCQGNAGRSRADAQLSPAEAGMSLQVYISISRICCVPTRSVHVPALTHRRAFGFIP